MYKYYRIVENTSTQNGRLRVRTTQMPHLPGWGGSGCSEISPLFAEIQDSGALRLGNDIENIYARKKNYKISFCV